MSQIAKSKITGIKRMNINVPVELHNSFKSVTAAEGKDMTTVLLDYIQKYVQQHAAAVAKSKGGRG